MERTRRKEDGGRPPLGSLMDFVETTTPGEMMQAAADIGSCSQQETVEDFFAREFGLFRMDEDTIPESAPVAGQVALLGVLCSSAFSRSSSDLLVPPTTLVWKTRSHENR